MVCPNRFRPNNHVRAAMQRPVHLKTAELEANVMSRMTTVFFVRPNLSIALNMQWIRYDSSIDSRFFRPPGPPTCVPLEHPNIQVLGWPRYRVCDESRVGSRQDSKGPLGKTVYFVRHR